MGEEFGKRKCTCVLANRTFLLFPGKTMSQRRDVNTRREIKLKAFPCVPNGNLPVAFCGRKITGTELS